MDKLLKKIQSYSFSDKDMMKIVGNEANLVTYPEIANYKSLDELLGENRACIILYLQKKNYGHWTCIFEREDQPGLINFYDPYGHFPDDELDFNTYQKNIKLKQDFPYLSLLMINDKDKYDFIYNPFKLQTLSKGNNICGRVVGLRLNFRDIDDKEFFDLLSKNKAYNKDEWVVMLTSFVN